MSIAYSDRGALRKVLPIIAIAAAMLLVAGFVYFSAIKDAAAAKPSDFGLKEGDTVSAAGSDDPDVYIVNDAGYKRLFLNPVIFNMYGHLGGFANVKTISAATRDAFPTSGLFRNCETNDQKVYGVQTTGEDTGMLHWVNTSGSQAVADDPNFFQKVFCINTNEFNWYSKGSDYTSVNQVPNYARVPGATGTPVPGNVSVSLASDNPASTVVVSGASGVTYLKLNFTGTGTVNSITVTRRGPGRSADFSNVYLYDGARRLTYGRSVNSSSHTAVFTGVNIAVNGSKTISVVADLASSLAGYVDYFSVDGASNITLSSGTVGGSFPISGNAMSYSNATIGQLTIANSGTAINPNVGQSNVEMAEFKFTADTEGARIMRIQLYQAGTVQPTNLNSIRAEVNGSKIADGVISSDGYIVFDMSSSPLYITKGDNRIVKFYGNISSAAKRDETIKLYVEQDADILAIGDSLGYGVSIVNSYADSTSYYGIGGSALTLQGGVLTLSFIGPTATNVSTTTTKSHLLDFDISAAAAIELRKSTVVLCIDPTGTGTYRDIPTASVSLGFGDLNNVAIVDRDSGMTLVGPSDGSGFTTRSTNADACGSSKHGLQKTFTDAFNINAGQTLHLAIVADVKTGNNTSDTTGVGLNSTDVFKAVIYGFGTQAGSSGDTSFMRYSGTNTAVKLADIVPSGDISGNNMTIQGSSLTIALAGSPNGAQTFVKGTPNVTAVAFNLSTNLGNPVTVNSMTVTAYTGATNAGVSASDSAGLVSTVRLVDAVSGNTVGSISSNAISSTGKVQFTNMNYPIPGGSTKTLLVKVDLGGNTPVAALDTVKFDIAATTDVAATDQNSNTVNSSTSLVNGTATTATTYITVSSAGTMTSAAGPSNPSKAAVYWGQNDAVFSQFRFTSSNEGFYIERLNIKGTSATNAVNNVDSVKMTYTNKAGATLTSSGTLNNAGSISFAFDGDNRPYVQKNGSADILVSANIKTANALLRTTGVNFTLDLQGGGSVGTDEFRAVGEGSGSVLTAANISAVTGQTMYAYRGFPKITGLTVSDPNASPVAGTEIYKFRVDAMGLASDGSTVFFDGVSSLGTTANASGSMKFAVLASGEVGATLRLELRDTADNSIVASNSVTLITSGPESFYASAQFNFSQKDIEITAGQSKTFVIKIASITGFAKPANTTSGRPADFITLTLRDNVDNLIYWTDKGGGDRNESSGSTSGVLRDFSTTNGPKFIIH